MRGLILALVHGDHSVWLGFASIWAIAAVTALLYASRTGRSPGALRAILLCAIATVAAAAAVPAVSALAVPRLRWRDVDAPDLIAPTGETWRKLRGPLVALVVRDAPEIAIPTVDARDRWVLFGLLSGKPIEGLEPAPPSTPELGGARLCRTEGEACRAWPSTWPDPQKAPNLPEITWSHDEAGHALAYDGDTKMFLNAIDDDPSDLALEVVGRVNADAPRDASSALFVVRGIGKNVLRSVRVVASPAGAKTAGEDAGPMHTFRLQREDARLGVATALAKWCALPLLVLLGLALPIGLVLLLLAPSLFARRLARLGATRRDCDQPCALVPADASRFTTSADDIDLGERKVLRGARVATIHPLVSGEPIVSRAWFFVASDDAIELAPADDEPFRRAAAAWMSSRLAPFGVLAIGLALAAPALIALVALAAAR